MSSISFFNKRSTLDASRLLIEVYDAHITEAVISVPSNVLYELALSGEASDRIRANSDGTISVDLPIEGDLTLIVRDTGLEDFLDHLENELNEADVPSDEIAG